jgi:outer membrane protein assembly factor BamD (BamD/ComL family)
MNSRNPGRAAAIYLDLMSLDAEQILPRQLQLDVANQLMSEGKWQSAADAYRKFLSRYSNYEYVEQVHLMLGLICARYLNDPQQALEYLNKAVDNLKDPGQKNMCQQEIEKIQGT